MNITKKIEKNLSKPTVKLLRRIGEEAHERGYKAYLVGGSVRDLLLGEKSPDIDIAIEGDAIRLGGVVARSLGAKLTVYRAFGTCTLLLKDGSRIDLATARKETYKRPGAFPKVKPSTLKDDLFRRDFTMNALAASINPKDFGRVVDLFGGVRDLERQTIRVMHDKSFIDDPTRIFRAMRFAARFGFKINSHTENLMKEAMAKNVFSTVSTNRIRKELSLLLKLRSIRRV